jgi:hypothetical protein
MDAEAGGRGDKLIFTLSILFQIGDLTAWKTCDVANMMNYIHDECGSLESQLPGVGTATNPECRKMLCVGLVCLDSIYVVKTFPTEDTDVR